MSTGAEFQETERIVCHANESAISFGNGDGGGLKIGERPFSPRAWRAGTVPSACEASP